MKQRFSSILLAVLFLTAVYLFAWPSANVPYFTAVILHLLAGIVLLIVLVFALRGILRSASTTSRIGWILIAIGGVLGVVLVKTGTRREEWPLLYAHIGSCVAGGALLASAWAGKHGFLTRGPVAGFARSAMLLAAATLAVSGAWWLRTVPWAKAHRIQNPAMAPGTMNSEGDGQGGPFFPSSAQTAHGGEIPANYFTESATCQRCHADIYKEWQSSAHHFSSFNNAWYRKSIEYMQDTVGVTPSKWCA
ncbi:MAG: hypothetical protein WB607_15120, partial [Candidatus Acidiferrum sp.]